MEPNLWVQPDLVALILATIAAATSAAVQIITAVRANHRRHEAGATPVADAPREVQL